MTITTSRIRKGVLLCLILIIVIIICNTLYKKEIYRKSITKKYMIDFSEISNFESFEDGKYFAFLTGRESYMGPTVADNKYILDVKRSGSMITRGYLYELSNTKSYDINLYDIHTGEFVKTINIIQILNQISDKWQSDRNAIGSMVLDGDVYACIPIRKKPMKGDHDESAIYREENNATLYISLQDSKYFIKTYKDDNVSAFVRERSQTRIRYLEFLEANGFHYFDNAIDFLPAYDNLCQIQLPVSDLPSKNEKLYNMFPGLKDVPRDSGKYVYIFLKDQPDDLSLLELIFEDDQEKYFEENLEHAWSDYETEEEKEEYRQLAEDYIKFKESKAENKDR